MDDSTRVAKEYLDGELVKCEKYELVNKSIKQLFETKERYAQVRNSKEGIGQTTLLKFLGSNWKQWSGFSRFV